MRWIGLALIAVLAACGDSRENDLETVGLKGDVKQVLEKTYGARMNEGKLEQWELRTLDEYHYSTSGILEQYFYHVPSRFSSEYNYYDKDGNPINYIMVQGQDTTVVRCEYRLTSQEQLADERYMIDERQTSRYAHRYDQGKLVETRSYDASDSLNLIQRFSYAKDGQEDTTRTFFPDGRIKQSVVKRYKGKWLTESAVLIPGRQGDRMMMKSGYKHLEFDQEGNWTLAHRYTTHMGRDTTVYEIIERDIRYYD